MTFINLETIQTVPNMDLAKVAFSDPHQCLC